VSNLIIQMAHLMSTNFGDIFDDDMDLLCDVADSSLWGLQADVGESCEFSDWLDVREGDPVTADIDDETDEYIEQHSVSDKTVTKRVGITFENQGTSASGLQRNMSKNAILARENREKKKQYIHGLERTVRDLSVKNKKLIRTCKSMHSTVTGLRREVNYLRGVIENQSELARLLKPIPIERPTRQLQDSADRLVCNDKSETVIASSCNDQPSFLSSLKSSESVHTELMSVTDCENLLTEHDYARSEKQNKKNSLSHQQFGVCLHVANQVTSLQLCALCNENAQ